MRSFTRLIQTVGPISGTTVSRKEAVISSMLSNAASAAATASEGPDKAA